MKRLQFSLLTCASFFIFNLCTSAYAETRANTLTFTLGGGYEIFASKRQIENTGVPFVAVGYNITNHWGAEALLGIFHTNFQDSTDKRQINGTLFSVDGLYHFSPYKIIEPYVLAGVGVTGLNPNGTNAHNEGNINAGAGFQVFANQVVGVRAEARDFYTITGGKNDVMLDAGVVFLLDLC